METLEPLLHPTDESLRLYGLGHLDDASSGLIHEHLETCPDCRKRAAGLTADSFLGRNREANRPSPRPIPDISLDLSSFKSAESAAGSPRFAATLPPGLRDSPDYQIKRELGRGGMGVVYLAHNAMMGRDEVLKVIGRQIMERPAVMERFVREIRAVAKLRHPNIVTAYSAFRIDGGLVFAMEYVEGLDLSRLVDSKGPLPVAHACYFIHQAAVGLQHAHERGMIHRDIKPHNLMLTHDGKARIVKILDFGLAKATREEKIDGGLTSQGQALGTPDYIAPEQILDAAGADIRADLYSLGGTLYYLLTGRPPFQANSLYDLYQAHISRDADPLNLVRPEVPTELAALVAKLMAKNPAHRFQTPGEVAEALKPFFKKAVAPTKPAPSSAEPARPRPSKAASASAPAAAPKIARDAPRTQGKSAEGPSPEGLWEGLIDTNDADPSAPMLRRAAPAKNREKPRWIGPAMAAGVLLMGAMVAWGAWAILIRTREGTIVLEGLPDQAEVFVDGEKATIHLRDGGPLEITAPAGRHGVQVKKDGFEVFGTEVTLTTGKNDPIRVTLKALETPEAVRPDEARPTVVAKPLTPEEDDERRNREILAKLERPIPMKYPDGRSLHDLLEDIRKATREPNGRILPIYVNPQGLIEADLAMGSMISSINLEGIPLKTTFRLALDHIGMDYCVKAGLIYITDKKDVQKAREASWKVASESTPQSAAILSRLDRPIAMRFPTDTPLKDVIEFIETATKGSDGLGLQIHVDPLGIIDADKTMDSTVAVSLEEIPLRTTLRLLLNQIGMGYYVKDGLVQITSWARLEGKP